MSSNTIFVLGLAGGVLFFAGIVAAWVIAPILARRSNWQKDRDDLRLKAESDLRNNALQSILGLGVLFTLLASLATLAQNQEKLDAERNDRLMIDFGSNSPTRQTEAINRLSAIWEKEGPQAAANHMAALASFLELNAPRRLKADHPPTNWELKDFEPVQRTRLNIQAAVNALAKLNERNQTADTPTTVVLKDVDLRDLSFQRLCLQGLDLSGCLLANSDFTGCYMQRMKAHGAWLEDSILIDAHLEDSILAGVHLSKSSKFSGAHVTGADMKDAVIDVDNKVPVKVLKLDKPLDGIPKGERDWEFDPPPAKTRPTAAGQK